MIAVARFSGCEPAPHKLGRLSAKKSSSEGYSPTDAAGLFIDGAKMREKSLRARCEPVAAENAQKGAFKKRSTGRTFAGLFAFRQCACPHPIAALIGSLRCLASRAGSARPIAPMRALALRSLRTIEM